MVVVADTTRVDMAAVAVDMNRVATTKVATPATKV